MVVKRGDVLVQLDRNPLEVFLLVWAVWTGASRLVALYALHDPLPPSAGATLLPNWVDPMWHTLLALGGLTALVGAYWKDAIAGVLIVRAGMWPMGAAGILYAAVAGYDGQHRTAAVLATFGGVCLWRAVQITKHVRAIRLPPRRSR